MTAIAERGCGFRALGGLYACTELSEHGRPITDFYIDPPIPMDTDALGMTRTGVHFHTEHGVTHVLDWIGEKNYPNAADFIEETARQGLSRRIPKNAPLHLLTPQSTIVLIHLKAGIVNYGDYRDAFRASFSGHDDAYCPTAKDSLHPHTKMSYDGNCIRYLWQDIEGGVRDYAADKRRDWDNRQRALDGLDELPPLPPFIERAVVRSMPSFCYHGFCRPDDVFPVYTPAAFLRLPISHLAVINDPEGGMHEDTMTKAAKAGLPVRLEDA